MAEEIIKMVEAYEAAAQRTIAEAEKARLHTVNSARRQAEEILAQATQAARAESAALRQKALADAALEKAAISAQVVAETLTLRQQIAPKLNEAKRVCR